jgi:hypothetical protein
MWEGGDAFKWSIPEVDSATKVFGESLVYILVTAVGWFTPEALEAGSTRKSHEVSHFENKNFVWNLAEMEQFFFPVRTGWKPCFLLLQKL